MLLNLLQTSLKTVRKSEAAGAQTRRRERRRQSTCAMGARERVGILQILLNSFEVLGILYGSR